MQLAKAMIASFKVRRESWPEGVYAIGSTGHRIGAQPFTICDIDDESVQPQGMRRYLTLCRDDPKGRAYPFRDLGDGLTVPQHDVVHFEVHDWQPSIDDLFATDWVAL